MLNIRRSKRGSHECREKLTASVLAFKGNDQERTRLKGRVDAFCDRAEACSTEYDPLIQPALRDAMADVKLGDFPSSFPDRDDQDDLAQGLPLMPKTKDETSVPKSEWAVKQLAKLNNRTFRLPSDCHSEVRWKDSMADLVRIKRAQREVQANEALDALRLHLTTYLALSVRKKEGTGIIHNTEADRRLQEKRAVIDRWQDVYRKRRHVLLVLGMADDNSTYRPLLDEDCKPFTILVNETLSGDSYKLPTWIWGNFDYARKLSPGELKTFVGDGKGVNTYTRSRANTFGSSEGALVQT